MDNLTQFIRNKQQIYKQRKIPKKKKKKLSSSKYFNDTKQAYDE